LFLYQNDLKVLILKKIHCELLANRMMNERLWNQMNGLISVFANIKHQIYYFQMIPKIQNF